MRNLKRALSLGLTAAMISGLMVMGSSAASYADVTSEDNQEAIEVLQAVEIMVGDENGDFNPDQNVTRNEMAVIMSNLMEYNVASYKNTSPFTDVPAWAEPYVAACWTNGITAGYSDTIYGGSDTVTTAQAALMLMKALGYFQYASDFGSDWQLATTRQGNAIDLFNGVDSGVTQPMTRNDVAQLVLNTLKSGTVEASTDGSWTIGDVTINNNVSYSYITSNQDYADAIDDVKSTSNTTDANRYVVELGEQLYMGDLKLNDEATDVFGRPARYWEYDGSEIGTYAKKELLKQSYTTEITGRDLYDLLGKSTIEEYGFDIYVDGIDAIEDNRDILDAAYFTEGNLVRGNTDVVGETGNGVLTEVYVDTNDKEVTIAIINTYLAKADGDYDDRTEEVDFDIWGIDDAGKDEFVKAPGKSDETLTVTNDDFDVEDIVDGDIYLVTVADGAIQSLELPDTISDTEITAFKNGYDGNLTVDGTKYNYSDSASYDGDTLNSDYTGIKTINLKDSTYNVYLDNYGYVIGVEEVDPAKNYVFITGVDENYSNLTNRNVDANAIFLDGTMEVIEVNTKKSDPLGESNLTWDGKDTSSSNAIVNHWYTYTVSNDGVYTLKDTKDQYAWDLGTGNSKNINQKSISLKSGSSSYVYGNDDTVYLNVSLENILSDSDKDGLTSVIGEIDNITTGVKNTDIEVKDVNFNTADSNKTAKYIPTAEIYTVWDDEGWALGVVVIGEDQGVSSDFAYVTSSNVSQESYDKVNDEYTWTREVVIDGKLTEISYVDDSLDVIGTNGKNTMVQGHWYKVTFYADGTVKDAELLDNDLIDTDYVDGYIDDVTKVETAVDAEDLVLYQQAFDDSDKMSLKYENGSLWVITSDKTGFSVSPDVKVVLANADGKGNPFDDVDDSYEGYKGLEDAIDDLNWNFIGDVSAILEDGVATTIILNCTANDRGYDPGDNTSNSVSLKVGTKNGTGIAVVEINGETYDITESSADTVIKVPTNERVSVKVIAVGSQFDIEQTEVTVNGSATVLKTTDGWSLVNVAEGDVLVITPKA